MDFMEATKFLYYFSRMLSAISFLSENVAEETAVVELENNHVKTVQCKTQTADCGLQTGGKMQTQGKMQTADCRPQTRGKMQTEGKILIINES